MQKQNRTLRRSVERKVPGYVRVIVALLYAATLLFTILGAMFGILFMPLALGSLFGGWYLMGEARVIYDTIFLPNRPIKSGTWYNVMGDERWQNHTRYPKVSCWK